MSMQEELTPRPMNLERLGLVLLVAAELCAAIYCCWELSAFRGWQRADPSMLRTSPDAAYLYQSTLSSVEAARGFLAGLLGTALVLAAFSAVSRGRITSTLETLLRAVAIVVPIVALALFQL